jgi:predicted chitinase
LAVPGCTRAEWECRYFGRGPIQLTWYLNYLDTSIAIFGDDRLVKEPWQVTDDPVVGWMTAIHFWMTNTGRESVTAHQAIRKGDFGKTISIVNGNQECGRSWDARAQTRVDKYVEYCRVLGVPPGKMLRC